MNARQQKRFEERFGPEPKYTLPNGPGIIDHNIWLRDQKAYSAACQDEAEAVRGLVEALLMAIRQNSHDMLMTSDELRTCEAAVKAWKGE